MPYPAFDFLNIFASSFERRSKQIVKPQKKNVWQYINSNKTLLWPISMAVATLHKASAEGACSLCRAKATSPKVRRPRADSSPAKSTSPPASSTPSAPPATAPPKNASPPANSKSSSPSSANRKATEPQVASTYEIIKACESAPLNQINDSEEP